jgi:hypothetical protein
MPQRVKDAGLVVGRFVSQPCIEFVEMPSLKLITMLTGGTRPNGHPGFASKAKNGGSNCLKVGPVVGRPALQQTVGVHADRVEGR